jgi:hypothetical protein
MAAILRLDTNKLHDLYLDLIPQEKMQEAVAEEWKIFFAPVKKPYDKTEPSPFQCLIQAEITKQAKAVITEKLSQEMYTLTQPEGKDLLKSLISELGPNLYEHLIAGIIQTLAKSMGHQVKDMIANPQNYNRY